MVVQRETTPDFQSEGVLDYLEDLAAGRPFAEPFDRADWAAQGYVESALPMHILSQERILLHAWHSSFFGLYSPSTGRFVREAQVWDLILQPCLLRISAKLLLKVAISPDDKSKVENAFRLFSTGDVEITGQIETTLTRDGVDIDKYYVILLYELERERTVFQYDNAQIFEAEASSDYRVQPMEKGQVSARYQQPGIPDDFIVVGDAEEPENALREDAGSIQVECAIPGLVYKRIGTAYQYPEYKIEWEMRDIRVGRCRIARTKLPVLYTRTTKRALYGYVITEEGALTYLRDRLERCIIEGAVVTTIIVIVTEGIGFAAGAAAFAAAVTQCIERYLSNDVSCLAVELRFVTEPGDWSMV